MPTDNQDVIFDYGDGTSSKPISAQMAEERGLWNCDQHSTDAQGLPICAGAAGTVSPLIDGAQQPMGGNIPPLAVLGVALGFAIALVLGMVRKPASAPLAKRDDHE